KHKVNSILQISFTLSKMLLSIGVLYFIAPKIHLFFLTQILCNLLQVIISRYLFWKHLPQSEEKVYFQLSHIKKIWRYASGMAILSLVTICFINIDKIILSKIQDLKTFGFYILATNLSLSLYMIISPVFTTYFTKITQLVALGNFEDIKQLYHKSCQV